LASSYLSTKGGSEPISHIMLMICAVARWHS
jgi:hypothetical protein